MESVMTDPVDPRDFGKLEGAVSALADKVAALTSDVESLSKQVKTLTDLMSEARGGWRAVAGVAGVAGTLGAAITWFSQHVTLK